MAAIMDDTYLRNAVNVHPTWDAFLFQIILQLSWVIKSKRSFNFCCSFLDSIMRVWPTVTDEYFRSDACWLNQTSNKRQIFHFTTSTTINFIFPQLLASWKLLQIWLYIWKVTVEDWRGNLQARWSNQLVYIQTHTVLLQPAFFSTLTTRWVTSLKKTYGGNWSRILQARWNLSKR